MNYICLREAGLNIKFDNNKCYDCDIVNKCYELNIQVSFFESNLCKRCNCKNSYELCRECINYIVYLVMTNDFNKLIRHNIKELR